MAKTRSARGGRTGRKAAKKSKARKARKPARRATARKAQPRKARKAQARKARKAQPRKAQARKATTRRLAKKAARKAPARPAARRPGRRPAKAAKPVRRSAKAPARRPAPKSVAPGPHRQAADRAAATAARKLPALNRERRRLAESDEELMPSAPSSLGYEGGASAARSGRSELRESLLQHTETGPALTGGDVDASWEDAYAVGDEAPGGDNPTPDQDRVDDIGKALGVQYEDNEELKGAEKIVERDRHRWELDPASSDDYRDRNKIED
jgi:hypothetical protein